MIHLLPTDIESRSTIDLGDVGAHVYATHPSTEILRVGYCADDGPVKMWRRGDPPPQEFITAANDTSWRAVIHNAGFDHLMMRHKLVPLHGFPLIPIERTICTMAMAHAAALPGALEKLARVCGFTHQKDVIGERIMHQMSKPRRPLKGEDKNGIYFYEDEERYRKLEEYCKVDVEATREAFHRLPKLSEEEYLIWLLDQEINNRGFYLDLELAMAARKIAAEMNPEINAELTKITNGTITAFTQVARITAWVQQHIPKATSLGKDVINELLERSDVPRHVRRVLELRLLGAQAAVAKVDAMIQRRCDDGRIRGSFVYHAAGPGRWSSRGAQMHNLKRPLTKDLTRAIEIIGSGDLKLAQREYKNPLSVIGDLIRSMVVAAPGHTLVGGDFSGIEARVTGWLANDKAILDAFRAYDEGCGPDPYIVTAAEIFRLDPVKLAADYEAGLPEAREYRQVGKAAVLAFGYQGGVRAYRKFAPETTLNDEEIEKIKHTWRNKHSPVTRLWGNMNMAAIKAMHKHPGKSQMVEGKLTFVHYPDDVELPMMSMTLPSGRHLYYPYPRHGYVPSAYGSKTKNVTLTEVGEGPEGIVFKDNASGAWMDVRMYGGLLTENAVQAIARDLLAQAMLRVANAGYKIVAHIHDEIVIEVPTKNVERIKPKFAAMMMEAMQWADGLPIVVKPWSGQRYVK